MKGEYGVRYSIAVGRAPLVKTTEKFFKTEKERTKFCEQIESNSNFVEFLAWCEPKKQSADHA